MSNRVGFLYCRVAQLARARPKRGRCKKHEDGGSSPPTATKINSKKDKIMKQNQTIDDQEVKYILRQIGFGAIMGIAFLATLYIGGLLAQCVSNF